MVNQTKAITLTAPGSKSVSHRLLICAALADRTSRLQNLLDSEDIHCTADCLRQLGAITSGNPGDKAMRVTGIAGRVHNTGESPVELDVRESGTTCRLLAAVVSAGQGLFSIRGRGRMHQRPLYDLARAVENQGTDFKWLEKHGCPPVHILGRGFSGGEIEISMDKSSQFLSGLLLAAPMAALPLKIHVCGRKAVSWPYVGLTLQAMHKFGARVEVYSQDRLIAALGETSGLKEIVPGETSFYVRPGPYVANEVFVEGDYSSASYLLAAGALGKSAVEVNGLDPDSTQGDRVIVDILHKMGANIKRTAHGYLSMPSELHGTDIDMGHCPDLVPTVAAAACWASGETRITNVAHLRLKESDRLAALESELNRAGFAVRAQENGLLIGGRTASGKKTEFRTHGDHRMAMSLSLLELLGFQVALDNPSCVDRSYPGFWEDLQRIKEANGLQSVGSGNKTS
ncbi:MAG: 3-phosphoshikimate 1-carboxyvinyltransferase [Desulfonatronovibrionaceae bacterium]